MNNIAEALKNILPSDKIKSAWIDRYSYASDASFYYLLPAVIVQPSLLEIKIFDSINFIADMLLPRLIIRLPKQDVMLHPVCSVFKMDLYDKLKQVGETRAVHSSMPIQAGCCGMAGDLGFYYPGLVKDATKNEADEVNEKKYDGYYSYAKTCEMSLSDATRKNYQSLFYLLDEVV